MRRREFIVLLGGAIAGAPLPARAQKAKPVIAFLGSGASEAASMVTGKASASVGSIRET